MKMWIDDEGGRSGAAKLIGADFTNVNGDDVAPVVEGLLSGEKPSLVVLDHVLDKTTSTNPIFSHGSTIAAAIKGLWPDCPVVAVTNAEVDRRTQRTYDALFPFNEFSYHVDEILAIERGFEGISKMPEKNGDALLQLLDPFPDDRKRLFASLPTELKSGTLDLSAASSFYSFVVRLFDRPGLLYDKLWAATFLGLTEPGFDKVKGLFDSAIYSGIFSNNDVTRWWLSKLEAKLYELQPPEAGQRSWELGRLLHEFSDDDFSRCAVCQNSYPDSVAFVDATSLERRQVHVSCTVLHPGYERELYFEDMRMMHEPYESD